MHYNFYRVNNKGADQTAHMRSLISDFVIRMLQNNGFFDGNHLYYVTGIALENVVRVPSSCYLLSVPTRIL